MASFTASSVVPWTQPTIPRVRLLFLLNVTLIMLLPLAGIVELSWAGAASAYAMVFAMNGLGIIITFHRYMSHGAFEFRWKWVRQLFLYLGTIGCSGSPLAWVAVHKLHHKHSDQERDPHNADMGLLNMQLVRYNTEDYDRVFRMKSVIKDPWCLFLHNYYFGVLLATVLALWIVGGAWAVYWLFIVPGAVTLFAENLVNWAAHKDFGYRNHETNEKSRNVWWLNILSVGDGWHNNHHANPRGWTTRERWWEIDPCGWVIRMVRA